jgi:diguanylate cyclase
LEKNFRKTDLISRFGGEEFLILLPNTSKRNAKKIIKRLQDSVEKDLFLKKYNITFSGGLTEYKKNDTQKSLKKRADYALYKAKKAGRNMVIII